MTTDWKKDLAEKITKEIFNDDSIIDPVSGEVCRSDNELVIAIEKIIKKFAEKRLVRAYFTVTE